MAGEGVTSPSALQQSAPTISVASPTSANANPQQLSAGVPQPPLAVNLAQQQNFTQNQQSLNQIAFAQQQPKAATAAVARSLHTQYVQNVPNPAQPQQPPSPAMGVQSPPQTGSSSIPRSSSASRVGQVSPNTGNIRAAAPNTSTGQFVGSPTMQQQQQQQQQQQMLALQRASQNQSLSGTPQRPTQSGQASHLQTGQLPGLMGGPSSIRSVYPTPYMQARTPMGGQMVMPLSQQYQQQMHARQKAGQVPATNYTTAVTTGSQLPGLGSMSNMGNQLTRPPGSVGQQSQPVNRMQPIQNRQLQNPQQLQPSSQLAQQQANTQKMSQGVGLQASSQPPNAAGNLQNQAQQAWMQKPFAQGQASNQAQQHQHQQGRSVNQRGGGIPPGGTVPPPPSMSGAITPSTDPGNRILGKRSIQDLVAQVDPTRRLDPEVEDMLLDIADDFIESVTTFSCKLAKHRKSNTLEAKDVLLHLSTNWDLSIPGFHGDEYRPYKRTAMNELHKQRLALVKKSLAAQASVQDSAAAKASGTGQLLNTTIPSAQAPAAV